MSNESDHVMRCPRCFGRDVRPSRNQGFLDAIMHKFRRTPFRCRGCHKRFYVYIPREKDELEESVEPAETPVADTGQPDSGVHNPNTAKPGHDERKPHTPNQQYPSQRVHFHFDYDSRPWRWRVRIAL